jgi:hypothetical protein
VVALLVVAYAQFVPDELPRQLLDALLRHAALFERRRLDPQYVPYHVVAIGRPSLPPLNFSFQCSVS